MSFLADLGGFGVGLAGISDAIGLSDDLAARVSSEEGYGNEQANVATEEDKPVLQTATKATVAEIVTADPGASERPGGPEAKAKQFDAGVAWLKTAALYIGGAVLVVLLGVWSLRRLIL